MDVDSYYETLTALSDDDSCYGEWVDSEEEEEEGDDAPLFDPLLAMV